MMLRSDSLKVSINEIRDLDKYSSSFMTVFEERATARGLIRVTIILIIYLIFILQGNHDLNRI